MSIPDQIAEVLREHVIGWDKEQGFRCVSISCDWSGHDLDFPDHVAEQVTEALQLTEQWGATCDQWNGGRVVRATYERAYDDAVTATERSRGQYAMLEPPPLSMDDMRIERSWVSKWEEA